MRIFKGNDKMNEEELNARENALNERENALNAREEELNEIKQDTEALIKQVKDEYEAKLLKQHDKYEVKLKERETVIKQLLSSDGDANKPKLTIIDLLNKRREAQRKY